MKLYDISLSVFPGMVVWPDNPNVTLYAEPPSALEPAPRLQLFRDINHPLCLEISIVQYP
ncbi:MAG: hypothetical protein HW418_4074 [Anaerolineales bacterium]|nr:hypothetical protein [Anaerolineales bacterium]